MRDHKLLQQIGLTESEAKLYLASLKLGPASAIQLGKKVELTRQMVYTLLPGLTEKGLIKEVNVGTKRLFEALTPEVLNDRANQISNQIKDLVPVLKTKQATNASLPIISVYENPISMREWYRRFMREAGKGDQLLIYATNRTWLSVDPDFLQEFVEFKKDNNITSLIIAPNTHESKQFADKIGQSEAEYRFADNYWVADAEKWIWNDTISYLTISENATNMIVIESPQLAAIERFAFREIWQKLKD